MGAVNQEALDKRAEETIGVLLRTGVLLAATIVLAGGILYMVRSGDAHVDYRVFRGEPGSLGHVAGIFREARALVPPAVIQFGLLVLIATPVARVIFSVWAFVRERDWMYVGITLVVLALLLYSLLLPH